MSTITSADSVPTTDRRPVCRALGQALMFLSAATTGLGLYAIGPELAILAILLTTAGAIARAADRTGGGR